MNSSAGRLRHYQPVFSGATTARQSTIIFSAIPKPESENAMRVVYRIGNINYRNKAGIKARMDAIIEDYQAGNYREGVTGTEFDFLADLVCVAPHINATIPRDKIESIQITKHHKSHRLLVASNRNSMMTTWADINPHLKKLTIG